MKGSMIRMAIAQNGEHFLEVPEQHWTLFHECWMLDHSYPSPMPVGHRMFRHPKEYNLRGLLTLPLSDFVQAARNALAGGAK